MAKVKVEELRDKRKKKEEELTNRILIVFGMSLLALFLLITLNRLIDNVHYFYTVSMACFYASFVLIAVAAAAAVCAAVLWKRSPGGVWVGRLVHLCAIFVLLAGAAGLVYYIQYQAFPLLYVVLIAVSFLYLVFNIYQRDFFVQAVVTGCAALTLYGFSRLLSGVVPMLAYVGYGVAALLLVAALGVTYFLSRRKGLLGGVRLLPSNANFPLMYFTYLALSAVLLAALLIGPGFSFWAMMAVLGYLFVLAVYYTIKLM